MFVPWIIEEIGLETIGHVYCIERTDWLRVYFKMVKPSGNLSRRKWRDNVVSIGKFTIVFPRVFLCLVSCNTLVSI